jgi:cation transport ATPase
MSTTVIIVAGACGVAAGTPLAILAGISSAARRGIIFKVRLYLEKLADIDTIVLDKTGTLRMGIPEVTGIRVVEGAAENEVYKLRRLPNNNPSIAWQSHRSQG